MLTRETPGLAFVVRDREQEHLARDERVVELLCFLVRLVQQAGQFAADLHVAVGALHLRQARDGIVQRRLQRLHMHAGTREQRARRAIVLGDERRQDVNRFDVLIVVTDGQTLRVGQCFLEFSGEFVDSHQETSNFELPPN